MFKRDVRIKSTSKHGSHFLLLFFSFLFFSFSFFFFFNRRYNSWWVSACLTCFPMRLKKNIKQSVVRTDISNAVNLQSWNPLGKRPTKIFIFYCPLRKRSFPERTSLAKSGTPYACLLWCRNCLLKANKPFDSDTANLFPARYEEVLRVNLKKNSNYMPSCET
jgi:hypothetical protein